MFVCLFVRPSDRLSQKPHVIFLNQIFCTCYLLPWLGPPQTAMLYVMYFRFVDDVMFSHTYGDSDVISSFLSMLAVFSRRDVRQVNVNILQHLQSDRRSGDSNKLFLIQFYLNNVTNFHQLTSHSTTSCRTTWRSYRDHRLLLRPVRQRRGTRCRPNDT